MHADTIEYGRAFALLYFFILIYCGAFVIIKREYFLAEQFMADGKLIKKVNKLILKIAHGDSRALEELFVITKKSMLYVAKTFLYDKNKAEDVLSEAYLKVVKNANSFNKTKNGYNWLYEITKNLALNENRIDKRDFPIEDFVPSYEDTEGLINKIEIDRALQILSADERRLIYAYYFEKKTLQEIADIESKSKSTIYERIESILKKLKNFLI